jgi:hypothetical protein
MNTTPNANATPQGTAAGSGSTAQQTQVVGWHPRTIPRCGCSMGFSAPCTDMRTACILWGGLESCKRAKKSLSVSVSFGLYEQGRDRFKKMRSRFSRSCLVVSLRVRSIHVRSEHSRTGSFRDSGAGVSIPHSLVLMGHIKRFYISKATLHSRVKLSQRHCVLNLPCGRPLNYIHKIIFASSSHLKLNLLRHRDRKTWMTWSSWASVQSFETVVDR